jgi:hypothetical protein
MAFDRQGNLLIADTANAAVRKVWAGTNAAGGSAGATLSAGRWSGTITQSNLRSPFQLTLTLSAPPLTRPGRVEIPSSGCVGTVRYLRTDASGRFVYAVTWQRGRCAAGTIWLRLLTGNALSYRWEDGRGVFSVGTLRPGSAPRATGTGSTVTRQLRTFADGIERILIQSAAGRRALTSALTGGFNCSITARAAGDAVNRVVANRQSLLRQLAALRAPTPQAANALALLRQGLRHSVEADIRYRDGFYALGASGCPQPPNRNFALARESDTKASTAKRRFVAAYNPLAKRVGRRTWSANQI